MYLRPDVHLARLESDVVLLDAGRGEYLCLAQAAEAFAQPTAGPTHILDKDLAEEAAALGLTGAGVSLGVALPPPAAADLVTQPDKLLTRADRVAGIMAYLIVLRRYHGRPFPRLLSYAARKRRPMPPQSLAALADQVTAFRQILPWAPFQGVCLYRSFYLLAFLRRRGFEATWVFGVQAWPFEAHCWLQVGDTVLDDSLDRVRPFTPILAI